jgi:uroporphyrinogen-III synthase
MRVIVTRPQSQAGQWLEALRRAGHVALPLPLIEIAPASDPQPVVQAWNRLARYDAVMFVSANAVDHFFALRPSAAAFTARAQVTGPGSLAALLRQGLDRVQVDAPDAAAGQFDSEALWATMKHHVVPGYRVLIVRGTGDEDAGPPGHESAGIGRDWFSRQVQAAYGEVDFVVAYQRRVPTLSADARNLLHTAAGDGSVWLFSSSEAVTNLQLLCPDQGWQAARALATHSRIAQVATDMGFGVVCTSRPALADLLASIESMP